MKLAGKVVVITGGTGGIGQAMAKAFLAQGAKGIVLADLDADLVAKVAKELNCTGVALVCRARSTARHDRARFRLPTEYLIGSRLTRSDGFWPVYSDQSCRREVCRIPGNYTW